MIRDNLIKERKGISPIIATLLLILIAIAAGVIVYAYVIGFVGSSTSGGGQPTTTLALDSSAYLKGSAGTGYLQLYLRNVGGSTATISSIYVSGSGISGSVQLTIPETGFTYSSCVGTGQYCSTGGVSTISASSVLEVEITATALGVTISSGSYTVQIATSDGSQFPFTISVK